MFTGLVEALGRVLEIQANAGSTRLGIESDPAFEGLERGESIAVDGACLTVVAHDNERFFVDVVQETLSRTTLHGLRQGDQVNLERSLRVGDRLGGHLVQGHVDGTAPVAATPSHGDDRRMRVGLTDELRRYVALKGSITLQGVSLTVSAVERTSFEVALIPETLARTNLGQFREGDRLNVEVDLLARYLESLIAAGRGPA
jgi:riboflavin synthase